MKLQEFLEKHDACKEGANWALATGSNTIEEIWLRDDLSFEWRLWIAIRVLDQKTLRKFACLCVREIWPLLTDERSRRAVEIAEQFAAGNCTAENLAIAARDAAIAYLSSASAARAAAMAAMAARAAAMAASSASWAAKAAAKDAAWVAARAARAASDALKKQTAILLELAPTITV